MTERHFRVVQLDGKKVEFGGVSITSKASPGSAARKLLTSIAHEKGLKKNKKASMPKVKFCIQEYTQGSSKKVYGPYVGHFHKYTAAELKKATTAKGKIKFTMKPVVKLSKGNMKGGYYNGESSFFDRFMLIQNYFMERLNKNKKTMSNSDKEKMNILNEKVKKKGLSIYTYQNYTNDEKELLAKYENTQQHNASRKYLNEWLASHHLEYYGMIIGNKKLLKNSEKTNKRSNDKVTCLVARSTDINNVGKFLVKGLWAQPYCYKSPNPWKKIRSVDLKNKYNKPPTKLGALLNGGLVIKYWQGHKCYDEWSQEYKDAKMEKVEVLREYDNEYKFPYFIGDLVFKYTDERVGFYIMEPEYIFEIDEERKQIEHNKRVRAKELAVQIKKNNNERNAMYAERTVATQQETPWPPK